MRWTIPEQPDLLEHGEDRPRRRWPVVLVAVVAVLALVGYGVVRLVRQEPPGAADAATSPSATGQPSAGSGRDTWELTTGACGSQAARPLIMAGPQQGRTGLHVLTGGAAVTRVDVDSVQARRLFEVPRSDRNQVQTLVRYGREVYALLGPCTGSPKGRVLRVGAQGEVREVTLSGPVDALIGGPAGVVGVDYPPDDATPGPDAPLLLRSLDGGTVRVDGSLSPLAVTRAGVVAIAYGEQTDGEPPQLVLVDRSTGHVTRTVAGGYPIGVSGDAVLWHGKACRYLETGPATRCVLHATDVTGGADRSYRLPPGRMPMSNVVASTDGRFVAFQLSDSRADTRYAFDHPGPPSAVAVLDLRTGRLQVMPGLELAPKTGVGLAFSADDRWLVTTVNEGDHGHLLVWRVGSDVLTRSPARLAGPLSWAPPILVLP